MKKLYNKIKILKKKGIVTYLYHKLFLNLNKLLKPIKPIGHPLSAMIEISTICNLQCELCPVGKNELKREAKFMDLKIFEQIIDKTEHISKRGYTLGMWGEPIIHPQLIDMITYIKKKNRYVSISTNGQLKDSDKIKKLVTSRLDKIEIEYDGKDQNELEKYRKGAKYDILHNFIKELVRYKKKYNSKLQIIAVTHIMKHNFESLPEIKNIVKQLKVDDHIIKPIRDFTFKRKEEFLGKYSIEKFNHYNLINDKNRICPLLWNGLYWDVEGNIISCCVDFTAKYKGKNITYLKGPKEIIDSFKNDLSPLRKKFIQNYKKIPVCKLCKDYY